MAHNTSVSAMDEAMTSRGVEAYLEQATMFQAVVLSTWDDVVGPKITKVRGRCRCVVGVVFDCVVVF